MPEYYLALDLKDDAKLIADYEAYHQKVWPEVLQQMKDNHILSCRIFRVYNRLFMILQTDMEFSFEAKGKADATNPKVMEWEALMWNYQQAIPGSKPGEKWQLMDCIFEFRVDV